MALLSSGSCQLNYGVRCHNLLAYSIINVLIIRTAIAGLLEGSYNVTSVTSAMRIYLCKMPRLQMVTQSFITAHAWFLRMHLCVHSNSVILVGL